MSDDPTRTLSSVSEPGGVPVRTSVLHPPLASDLDSQETAADDTSGSDKLKGAASSASDAAGSLLGEAR
ncbi:hypothetical protein, partial [Cellulomonas rhizosphaerae]